MKNTYSQAAWKHLSVKRKRYWSQKAPISLLFPSLYCFQQFLGNCFQGHAKLDPRDCNNYIPVVLTFSFVPQAAEDRQGAICYVRWPLASCELWRLLFWHATVYFWANFVKSEAIIVILEKDNGKIMSIYWSISFELTLVKMRWLRIGAGYQQDQWSFEPAGFLGWEEWCWRPNSVTCSMV